MEPGNANACSGQQASDCRGASRTTRTCWRRLQGFRQSKDRPAGGLSPNRNFLPARSAYRKERASPRLGHQHSIWEVTMSQPDQDKLHAFLGKDAGRSRCDRDRAQRCLGRMFWSAYWTSHGRGVLPAYGESVMPRYFFNVEDEDHQIKDVEVIDKSDRLIEASCMPSH